MLTVTVEDLGDVVILSCAGRIVRGEETKVLCAAVHRYGRNILLDLSRVESIDAAGVGALIALQAAGIYLRVMNPSKAVREVFRVTNLESVLEIAEGETTPARELQGEAHVCSPDVPDPLLSEGVLVGAGAVDHRNRDFQ